MTAYSLKTASKGCLTAVTLNITMAGDVHDKSAYIVDVLPVKVLSVADAALVDAPPFYKIIKAIVVNCGLHFVKDSEFQIT